MVESGMSSPMASGCIFGECIKCGEHVWEDQGFTFDEHDRIKHNGCKTDWQAKAMLLQKELNVWYGYSEKE
jgi:hypothetical protein